MQTPLISTARAAEQVPGFANADTSTQQDIVDAASAVIQKKCNRDFVLQSYDELLDGTGYFNLLLSQYPVTSINRVSLVPVQAIQIRNVNQSNSRAMVSLSGTQDAPPVPYQVTLSTTLNGVVTTNTINCNTTNTLTDLQNAINGYASLGWNALALGQFANWPVAELRPPQGAYECRWALGYFSMFSISLFNYDFNPEIGEIVAPFGFCRGYRNYRCLYQAGYATVPEPIQNATAELVGAVWLARGVNPNTQMEQLGGYQYQNMAEHAFKNLSAAARFAIEAFTNHRVAKFKAF